jgi:hypothetical protein
MKRAFLPLVLFAIGTVPVSCASPHDAALDDYLRKGDDVRIFTVPLNGLSRENAENGPETLQGFPFITFQPVLKFRGKYSPEFYARFPRTWKAESIRNVDFWKLRDNPSLYDVIYVTPLWVGDLKTSRKDLLSSLAYSLNIPGEQVEILREWIRRGGVLWMESVFYSSSYDYRFKTCGEERINGLARSLGAMSLFGRGLNVFPMRAKITDAFTVEKLSHEIRYHGSAKAGSVEPINAVVRSLLLEQTDYLCLYVTVDGIPVIRDGNRILASYVDVGRGKVLTLAPFDFRNAYYDGELFRLTLLTWALGDK